MKLILVANWHWKDSGKPCRNKAVTLESHHEITLDEVKVTAPAYYGDITALLSVSQARSLGLLRSRWSQLRKLRGNITLGVDGNPVLDLPAPTLERYKATMAGTGLVSTTPAREEPEAPVQRKVGPARLLPD